MPKKAPAANSSSKNLSIPLNSQTLLVVLLIVVSFFTGYLFFKVQNLEKGAGDAQVLPEQQAPELNLSAMPKVTDKDHIRGSVDAQIVLVEYSDLECPFCQQFHPTMTQLKQEYGDKLAWVYRHYPLSFHPKAQKSAEASECVAEQGGNDSFWEFTDAVFEKMPDIEVAQLPALAGELGLDAAQVQSCMDSGKYADLVKEQLDGGSKTGISGTPGTVIVVNGEAKDLINGALPYEQAKAQIDALLK